MSKRKISPARGKRTAGKARKPAGGKRTASKARKPARKVAGTKRSATKSKSPKRKRSKPASAGVATAKRLPAKTASVTRNAPPEAPPPDLLANDDHGQQRSEHELPESPSVVHPRPDVERVVASKRRRSLRHGAQF